MIRCASQFCFIAGMVYVGFARLILEHDFKITDPRYAPILITSFPVQIAMQKTSKRNKNYLTSSDPHRGISRHPSDIASNILSGILSHILSGNLSSIFSDILSGILFDILSDIFSGLRSDLSSDIAPDILCDIFSGILL